VRDVSELIPQYISTSICASKDAGPHVILSIVMVHAWSTITCIRFCPSVDSLREISVNEYQRKVHELDSPDLTKAASLKFSQLNFYLGKLDLHLSSFALRDILKVEISPHTNLMEVDNVPSLRLLVYHASWMMWCKPTLFKMGTIGSLRELYLDNVSMDDAFSSMIKSSFPFLESLTLIIKWCSVEILNIRCLTLRSLNLCFRQDKPEQEQQIKVQVYAPNLLCYSHTSMAMPTLLFLTIPPKQIELSLRLYNPIDELFFLKMREALELSSKFNINILAYGDGVLVPAFNIDDMRTILPFPATIVEELVFFITINSVLWENSLLFDAFFSICHPIYVKTNTELTLRVANYFLSLIGKVYCEIRNPLNGSWVALTSSSLSLLDTTTPRGCIFEFELREFEFTEFKLIWCSP
ncbi:hypothetical protein Tco_1306781, partial [Tanacetum coccineum]